MPRLIRRIDEVLKLPYITEARTVDIELISVRVGVVFTPIREAVDADEGYNRLIASTDPLRAEIVAGDAALDRMLKTAAG